MKNLGKDSQLTLAHLEPDQSARVLAISGANSAIKRMIALGFSPGAEVKMIRLAPLGDPMEFEVSGCLLTLRSEEARSVIIEAAV